MELPVEGAFLSSCRAWVLVVVYVGLTVQTASSSSPASNPRRPLAPFNRQRCTSPRSRRIDVGEYRALRVGEPVVPPAPVTHHPVTHHPVTHRSPARLVVVVAPVPVTVFVHRKRRVQP